MGSARYLLLFYAAASIASMFMIGGGIALKNAWIAIAAAVAVCLFMMLGFRKKRELREKGLL